MNTPEHGAIVLIHTDDGLVTARVVRGKRDQIRVETSAGTRELDGRERWQALPLRAPTLQAAHALVAALRARVSSAELGLLLDALEGQDTTVGTLSDALLGAIGPEDRAATLIALLDEDGRVAVQGHDVRTRSAVERAEHAARRGAAREAAACLTELTQARTAVLTYGRFDGTPSPALVALLEGMATGRPAPTATWEQALLGRASIGAATSTRRTLAAGAARALADLKIWDGHEDLALLRSGLLAPWPASADVGLASAPNLATRATATTTVRFGAVQAQATPLHETPLHATPCQATPLLATPSGEPQNPTTKSHDSADMTRCDLPFRAIDSVDPDEVDDALWAERVGDDVRLVVAFASPSLWIAPRSPADLEARRRGVTLYHPRHLGRMLPAGLLEQSSLTVGAMRPALICELLITPDGSCALVRLHEARIELAEALVYDDVQVLLDAAGHSGARHDGTPAAATGEGAAPLPDWLDALREATERSEAARIRAGGYLLYRPDIEVRAPAHVPATLRPAPQSSLARRLVAEAMVQACAAVGVYMRAEGLPLPYRTQQIRRDPPLEPGFYVEPADVQSMLGHLGPAQTSARPGRHDILGVDSYVQISSPLRRYPDLLAHYQLIAWLRGQRPPFDRGQIDTALGGQRAAVRERRAAGQRGQRYFQLLDLAREGLGAKLRAQVIRAGGPQGRSIAFDSQRVLQIDLPSYLAPVGAWLDLEVVAVDAADGKLEVRAVNG